MASRSLGVLTLDLVAKTGGFERGMDQAARAADKRMKQIEVSAKRAGKIIGTALVAGLAIAAIGIKSAINRMDDLSKAAQRVQMPTEEFSRLAFAGQLADVSMEDLQTSLGRLTKAMGASNDEGSRQARVFSALGIEVKNLDGSLRSPLEVFKQFADVFKENRDSPELLAAGMEIFGRSFQNLIPLLKDGSAGLQQAADESDRLGNTLSTEAGRSAEAFNDNLTRLNTVVKGFWQEVASGLLPALEDTTNRFVDIAREGNLADNVVSVLSATFSFGVGLIEGYNKAVARTTEIFSTLAALGPGVKEAIANFGPGGLFADGSFAGGVQKVTGALKEGDAALASINAGAKKLKVVQIPGISVTADANAIVKAEADAIRRQREFNAKVNAALGEKPKTGGAKKAGKSDAEREAESLARAYQSMNERLDEQNALFGKVGEEARVRYEIEHGALKGLAAAEADVLIQKARRNDLQREEHDLFEKSMRLAEEEARAAKQLAERQSSFVEDMKFELSIIGLTSKERARAIALRYAEADANSALGRTIIDLSDKYEDARKAQALWMDFQQSLGDAFVDLATGAKSLKDVLTDFFDSIAQAIARSIAESWAENITGWFKGMTTKGDSSGGGFWANLFGAVFGGGKANGGSVQSGMLYQVNERGTEMFSAGGRDYLLAGTNGTITPANKLGGAFVQNVQFVMPERPSPNTQSQMAQRAAIASQTAARRNG